MVGMASNQPSLVVGTGRAASRAGSMTEMMGAPGLVPFDVMIGQAGQWMVGYQFMAERMEGNLVGSHSVSDAQVLADYEAAPTEMSMEMHMVMAMYAPTDRLTLMAMLPYVRMSMDALHRDGTKATESTEGIGDLEIRGTYRLHAAPNLRHTILGSFGAGFPTGSIYQRDPEGMRMEYPMQTGSGTFSLLPGVTYLGQALPWGWAVDFNPTIRVGRNEVGYLLGNRYQASASVARELSDWASVSVGARGELWNDIHGADPLLDPAEEPTKDPRLQGGRRLSALLGFTFHPQHGRLSGQHFHVLGELPVLQSLDGPQLKRIWVIRLGWQLEF